MIVRSFLLKEKNQKFKAVSAELLRHFVSLCAPQTRCAQTATLRPLHFVPTLNAHQNEANPMDNWELTIENYLFFSLIYQWYRFRDCRGAALLRLTTSFHNQMGIKKNNEWIYSIIRCSILSRYPEAQHAAPLLTSLIVNCQFSIVNWFAFIFIIHPEQSTCKSRGFAKGNQYWRINLALWWYPEAQE